MIVDNNPAQEEIDWAEELLAERDMQVWEDEQHSKWVAEYGS